MLKKVGAVAAIAASMMIIGSPAFAAESTRRGGADVADLVSAVHELDQTHQVGLVNFDDSDLLSDINACHLDVNVIAVPVLSGNDSGVCANVDGDHH
jgi:hypothetical protein